MIHSKFYNHSHSRSYQNYKCDPNQSHLSKCWTIQIPIWEPWGASVICTSKFLLSDPYLQRHSHNNGGPNQWVPNHRCQWDKWTLHFSLLSPHKVWPLSYKDLSYTHTLMNCSNNACHHHITITSQDQSDTFPPIMLRQQRWDF